VKLKVRSAPDRESYLDIARIHHEYRKTRQGQPIESGSVFRVYCTETGKEAFLIARGLSSSEEPRIHIDYQVRQKLGVTNHQIYDFDLRKGDFCSEVWWALHATDTQYSFAAKISLISLALGLIGLAIALVGFFR
jgi:hypothetical protein